MTTSPDQNSATSCTDVNRDYSRNVNFTAIKRTREFNENDVVIGHSSCFRSRDFHKYIRSCPISQRHLADCLLGDPDIAPRDGVRKRTQSHLEYTTAPLGSQHKRHPFVKTEDGNITLRRSFHSHRNDKWTVDVWWGSLTNIWHGYYNIFDINNTGTLALLSPVVIAQCVCVISALVNR